MKLIINIEFTDAASVEAPEYEAVRLLDKVTNAIEDSVANCPEPIDRGRHKLHDSNGVAIGWWEYKS